MPRWLKEDKIWRCWPSQSTALIEMIGGSYLAAAPQISYRNLLETLYESNLAINTWSYVPSLDHQSQSNQAWKEFREIRLRFFQRLKKQVPVIRIGHSLGCKLHLLAPDNGRNCNGIISISFNNYSVSQSIPIIKDLSPKIVTNSEFSPSPRETYNIISKFYYQPNNLIVKFDSDEIDQGDELLKHLQSRRNDSSKLVSLRGNHLTPASTGMRRKLFYKYDFDTNRTKDIIRLSNVISESIKSFCP